jgi:hypothetical protein
MKTMKITCDRCEADLTTTGNCEDYRLALVNERVPSRGGATTDMIVYPLINVDMHFCGLTCLTEWVNAL